jgi:hypothetical protein
MRVRQQNSRAEVSFSHRVHLLQAQSKKKAPISPLRRIINPLDAYFVVGVRCLLEVNVPDGFGWRMNCRLVVRTRFRHRSETELIRISKDNRERLQREVTTL